MEMETLLPIIFSNGKIKDGFLVQLPLACKKYSSCDKCVKFHRQVMDAPEVAWAKCHRGYIVCKTFVNDSAAAFIGLRVKNISPRSCFNENGMLKHQYTKSEVEALIDRAEQYIGGQVRLDNLRRYLPDLIHSLAKVLDSADSNGHYIAEQMLKDADERDYHCIGETAITVGMAAIQAKGILYQANVQAFGNAGEQVMPVRVYSKFVRASLTLRHLRKNARIDRFEGPVVGSYRLTPSFGMIPYLIFDNALKYSPKSGLVKVVFTENETGLDVSVSNVGPYVPADCMNKIWENNYRTESAKKFTTDGSGIGLCTVASILKTNGITAKVTSVPIEGVKVNGVHMGNFQFVLHIPVELKCLSEERSEMLE